MAHRDLLKMNFTEYIVFSEIPHNENDMSKNLIYIGMGIGSIFGILILIVKFIFKPKNENKKITEISI